MNVLVGVVGAFIGGLGTASSAGRFGLWLRLETDIAARLCRGGGWRSGLAGHRHFHTAQVGGKAG